MAGHSMGGYVALAFTRAYPKRVLGLGLVSSQALADSPEKKAGRYQEAESILANGVKEVAEGMSVKLTARPDLQSCLKELILRQRPEGLAGALRAMAERPDSTPMLSGLDLPFVMVHGLADALIPIERARVFESGRAWRTSDRNSRCRSHADDGRTTHDSRSPSGGFYSRLSAMTDKNTQEMESA